MVGIQPLRTLERKKQNPRKHVAKRLSHYPTPCLYHGRNNGFTLQSSPTHALVQDFHSDKGQEDNGGAADDFVAEPEAFAGTTS